MAPVLTVPQNVTVAAVDADGTLSTDLAIQDFLAQAKAEDDVDGPITPSNDAPAVFPLGDTVVTFSATDAAGNTATATATVTVADLTAPVVTAPSDITVQATTSDGSPATDPAIAAFLAAATAEDNVDGDIDPVNDATTLFSVGSTLVTFSATDAAGNVGTATAAVNVLEIGPPDDTTPPELTVPQDTIVAAVDASGTPATDFAIASFLAGATALDGVDGPITPTNNAPATFPLGPTIVIFTAVDLAGNTAARTATLTVVDQTSPTLTIPGNIVVAAVDASGTPAVDAAIASFLTSASATDNVDGAVAPVGDAPDTFPLGATIVTFTATDIAGNSASAMATVTIEDQTPPVVTAPASLTVNPFDSTGTPATDPEIGSFLAEASAFDNVDGALTPINNAPTVFSFGETIVTFSATDSAGNTASAEATLTVADINAPGVTITSPDNLGLFSASPITVTGTVDDDSALVSVNGVSALVTGNSFSAEIPLREGTNVIAAVATDASGNAGTASISVTLDTTPPTVSIETPREGAVLTSLQADVAGMINDIITGTTINGDDVTVAVNGIPAMVANRSYVVSDLLLQRGLNTITAEVEDRAGNRASRSIQVNVQDQAGQRLVLVSGNGQTATVNELLPDPLVVTLLDAGGDPVPGRTVTFRVSRGDGLVRAFPDVGKEVSVLTDDNGLASVLFALGGRAGAGNHRVTATASGFLGEVEFCASPISGPAEQITTVAGDNQRGAAEQDLPEPFLALVTDLVGNAVSGVEIEFNVLEGGGTIEGQGSVIRTTNMDGEVTAVLTLGAQDGINNNVVVADAQTTFTATGQSAGAAADTSVSGVVLDNQDIPLPGTTVSILGTGLIAVTNDEGQFLLDNAPVGAIALIVDGRTTSRAGE